MRQFIAKEGDQVGRFAVSGGICVGVYYVFLIGLTEVLHVWYMTSTVVAFAIFFVVQFTLHKFWTFKNMDRTYIKQQLMLYSLVSIANWLVNTGLLYILVEYARMWYLAAQIILTVIMSILAYFVFKQIFSHRQPNPQSVSEDNRKKGLFEQVFGID